MLRLDATPEGTDSVHGFMALQMKGKGKSKIVSHSYNALWDFSSSEDLEVGEFLLGFLLVVIKSSKLHSSGLALWIFYLVCSVVLV